MSILFRQIGQRNIVRSEWLVKRIGDDEELDVEASWARQAMEEPRRRIILEGDRDGEGEEDRL